MRLLWDDEMLAASARRLGRIFDALQPILAKELAEKVGVSPQCWTNYIKGRRPVHIPAAVELLRLLPGLTLDWLYTGDESGLSVRVRDMLVSRPPSVHIVRNVPDQPVASARKRNRNR